MNQATKTISTNARNIAAAVGIRNLRLGTVCVNQVAHSGCGDYETVRSALIERIGSKPEVERTGFAVWSVPEGFVYLTDTPTLQIADRNLQLRFARSTSAAPVAMLKSVTDHVRQELDECVKLGMFKRTAKRMYEFLEEDATTVRELYSGGMRFSQIVDTISTLV